MPYSIPDDPLAHLPFPLRLRSRIEWWKKNGKDRDVVHLIQCGVCPCWSHPPDLPWMAQSRNVCDQKAALEILQEYLEIGAVRKVSMAEVKFLVPWFVIRKPEGDGVKLRLISDCRKINNFLSPSHFKLDHWQNIFPFLRKGMWACKVDLKHAYFHLGVGDELKPYLCVKVGDEVFQFQAACFGLSTLPQIWMNLMKVFQRKWRVQRPFGVHLFGRHFRGGGYTNGNWQGHFSGGQRLDRLRYVDQSPKVGIGSHPKPDSSWVSSGFREGRLLVPTAKLKAIRKELGKLVTHSVLSCRKMAAILGQVRSFLTAMPFLRAFTGHLVQFVQAQKLRGWDVLAPIPEILKSQILQVKSLLQSWEGRSFGGVAPVRTLHSDSSDHAWGGLDVTSGCQIQEFWREAGPLHINVKELRAAVDTVKSLAHPAGGGGSPLRGQQCCLLLPQERRWKAAAPKCHDGVSVAVVHGAAHSSASKPSCVRGAAGRWPKPHPRGSGGLHSFLPCVFPPFACNTTMGST